MRTSISPYEIRLNLDDAAFESYQYLNTNMIGDVSFNVTDGGHEWIWPDGNVTWTYGDQEVVQPLFDPGTFKFFKYYKDHPISDNPVMVTH